MGDETEHIYGGGEQYTYLDLKGRRYPIWVREQGVGRNKSSIVTIAMDLALHGGGDYHTTYWPQASYLSSRKYYIGTPECCTEYSLCNKVLPRVHVLRLPGAGLQPGRPQHHLLALHRARAGGGRGGVRRVPHLHPHQTIAHGNCPGNVRICLTHITHLNPKKEKAL